MRCTGIERSRRYCCARYHAAPLRAPSRCPRACARRASACPTRRCVRTARVRDRRVDARTSTVLHSLHVPQPCRRLRAWSRRHRTPAHARERVRAATSTASRISTGLRVASSERRLDLDLAPFAVRLQCKRFLLFAVPYVNGIRDSARHLVGQDAPAGKRIDQTRLAATQCADDGDAPALRTQAFLIRAAIECSFQVRSPHRLGAGIRCGDLFAVLQKGRGCRIDRCSKFRYRLRAFA